MHDYDAKNANLHIALLHLTFFFSTLVLLFRLLEVGSLLDIIKHKMKSADCKVSTLFYSLSSGIITEFFFGGWGAHLQGIFLNW
jgi:hypothetical protein